MNFAPLILCVIIVMCIVAWLMQRRPGPIRVDEYGVLIARTPSKPVYLRGEEIECFGVASVSQIEGVAARDIQLARYAAVGMPHIRTNAEAPASRLGTIKQPDTQAQKLLRVARTLADLDGMEKIGRRHLAEALSYRALAEDLRRAA